MPHQLGPRYARLASAALVGVAVVSGCGGKAASSSRPIVPHAATNWLTGPAGERLTALNADLGRLAAAQRAGDHSRAASAGVRLAADARAALAGPSPPAEATLYRSALIDFERASSYIASRKYSLASRAIAAGNVGITKVTSAANNLDRPART